jgi:hypothetical protein
MPHELTCQSCGNPLRIPRGLPGRWLTCPRCLASLGNPDVLDDPQARREPGREPREAPADQPRPCPACGRPVEREWRSCPFCEEPLRARPERRRQRSIEDQIKRDSGVGLLVGGLLLLLLGVGAVCFFGFGGFEMVLKSPSGVSVLLFLAALAGLVGGGGAALMVPGQRPGQRAMVGFLSGLGIILAGLVLCALATVFVVFQACARGCH